MKTLKEIADCNKYGHAFHAFVENTKENVIRSEYWIVTTMRGGAQLWLGYDAINRLEWMPMRADAERWQARQYARQARHEVHVSDPAARIIHVRVVTRGNIK